MAIAPQNPRSRPERPTLGPSARARRRAGALAAASLACAVAACSSDSDSPRSDAIDGAGADVTGDAPRDSDTEPDDANERDAAADAELDAPEPDTTPLPPPSLIPANSAELPDHVFVYDVLEDPLAIGPGGGFVDPDGDGRVDLFLGDSSQAGTAPCLYRNVSEAGRIAFEPVPHLCEARWPRRVYTATSLPTRGSAGERVLVGGSRFLAWLPMDDEGVERIPNLFDALLNFDDPRRRCNVSALLPADVDLDGDLEVYIACGHAAATSGPPRNLVLELVPEVRIADLPDDHPLANHGPTLAAAYEDIDRDGVPELALANDTLSGPAARNTTEDPGGVIFRASPFAEPELTRYSDEVDAWGSFMGIALLPGTGGLRLYLTDRGPNRYLQWTGDGFDDVEVPSDRLLGYGVGNDELFAWGAVLTDFDGDLAPDLYVTQGDVWSDRIDRGVDVGHRDAWMPVALPSDTDPTVIPLGPPHPRAALLGVDDDARNVRSAAAVDLDGDGVVELVTIPLQGRVRIDRLGSAPSGCTLRPVPSVVPARTSGFDLVDTAHSAGVEGRTRLGAPPTIHTPVRSGTLRFPSGYSAPFSCDGPGVTTVEEPVWLSVTFDAGRVQVVADTEDATTVFVARGDAGPTAIDGSTAEVSSGDRVAVRVGARWVPRVWTAP